MTAIQELEERYSSGVYAKRGVTIVRGEGTRLWDDQGKEYIDCAAGMVGQVTVRQPLRFALLLNGPCQWEVAKAVEDRVVAALATYPEA